METDLLGRCSEGLQRDVESEIAPGTDVMNLYCDTMRVELIGHFKPCMTGIYLHI